ncbi:MAG: alpha/beta hydrolase [Planctomycetaceae bacterium]|nr:alpha/beta hydrolase [Planctomycetaceae bacterium]
MSSAGSLFVVALLAAAPMLSGCGDEATFASSDRLDKGLVVILPGIEGESSANHELRQGLLDSNIPYALVIHKWGFPIPGLGLLVNQTDSDGNRRAAESLAEHIAAYQAEHPGKPVYLVGHSGGGGVAVFTLEALAALPGAKPVEGAFLLSASLSADYPLATAMTMTRKGICNIYNPDDTNTLGTGTAVFGNVDGGHGDSAGRTGIYGKYPKLYQINASRAGARGNPHFIVTKEQLVLRAAPLWLSGQPWPPKGSIADQK